MWCFEELEPPEQGGVLSKGQAQLPFVMRRLRLYNIFMYKNYWGIDIN
jgi:hypothetical protein